MLIYAGLAQLVEQRIRNAWVECSSHLTGTRFFKGFESFSESLFFIRILFGNFLIFLRFTKLTANWRLTR